MALTERFENDKIEVVGQYKVVQVRKATVIEKWVGGVDKVGLTKQVKEAVNTRRTHIEKELNDKEGA